MQELPFNDVYSAGWMSSDITLWYLQLLPLWLKILNFFVKCLHENIQYLWFICCPRIFDNFDAQKCILKLEWPLSFSLSISDDRINLILVWRLSLIIFETSGLAVFMDTLHPNIAAPPSGSKRSSTPSIRNCLEKTLHLVADSSAANWIVCIRQCQLSETAVCFWVYYPQRRMTFLLY